METAKTTFCDSVCCGRENVRESSPFTLVKKSVHDDQFVTSFVFLPQVISSAVRCIGRLRHQRVGIDALDPEIFIFRTAQACE